MREAMIVPLPFVRFQQLLAPPLYASFTEAMERAGEAMSGRTLWNINTTLTGGGVAELLSATLPYVREAGITTAWVMIDSDAPYLDITKRLHNWLHGFDGDNGALGRSEKKHYDKVIRANAEQLLPRIAPGDVVVVHDPQPAGLIPLLKQHGAQVIWHCHIGTDTPNDLTRQAWSFLGDEVRHADAVIFTRKQYLWDGLDPAQLHVIQPSINPFSAKNQELPEETADAILKAAGISQGTSTAAATFVRNDATPGDITSAVTFPGGGGPLPDGAPYVLQSARWDRLKDHAGVLALFAGELSHRYPQMHLILAGPSAQSVSDDPEGAQVLSDCVQRYQELDRGIRERVHLVACPLEDPQETEAIVNAMQRQATVVLQKSQAEGFGLVISEAMWKCRPVVASRVGGIQDQIENGHSGILIDDPTDGFAFACATVDLIEDPHLASQIGQQAQQRVREHFLSTRQLTQTMALVAALATP